jgi:hypothetical protein
MRMFPFCCFARWPGRQKGIAPTSRPSGC